MLAFFQRNPKVLLDRKPLRFRLPRLFFIDHLAIEMPEELGDVLVHLNKRYVLPNAAATSHAKLITY